MLLNFLNTGRGILGKAANFQLKSYATVAKVMSNSQLKVLHRPEDKQFVAELGDLKEKAHLDYEVIGEKTWDLQHTLVPESFRGQGVAKVLAKTAFDHIVKEDLKMKLTCWYLRGYVDKNPLPEYKERIVE